MAQTDYSRPLGEVTFRCSCKRTFSAVPARVDECPARDWHPWDYVADCPDCGEEAGPAHWWLALLKGWQNATGPKTPEGIAATTANLAGHPTPEEALRTRFNAMKHGLSAKTATYFPARPDGYAFCKGCEADRAWCGEQAACSKQLNLFMQHHAAFEQRNPRLLSGIYADLQAGIFALAQQMLQTILADGAKIESPQYYTNKDGDLIIAEYIDEQGQRRVIKDIEAHPLIRQLNDLLQKNGMTLADLGMTQKVVDDEEQEMGRLQSQQQAREDLTAVSVRQAKALEDLKALMESANASRARDPVLIEHQQQSGGGV